MGDVPCQAARQPGAFHINVSLEQPGVCPDLAAFVNLEIHQDPLWYPLQTPGVYYGTFWKDFH